MAENLSHEPPIDLNLDLPLPQPKWRTLLAGAAAGLAVDTSLYPIDTVKSRLQSKQGFIKAGGFKEVYRGLPPVLAASVPTAAVFFITYESIKNTLNEYKHFGPRGNFQAVSHSVAASLGEVASCLVRVPCEIVKIRSQTADLSAARISNLAIFKGIIAREGLAGTYRGFFSTVMRDAPFSALTYPIWERLKTYHSDRYRRPATVYESAFYGSIASAFAAFLTTPLDVSKTRIMLAEKSDSLASGRIRDAMRLVYSERGVRGLFAGVMPRVVWISVGGAIFLGAYEQALKMLKFD